MRKLITVSLIACFSASPYAAKIPGQAPVPAPAPVIDSALAKKLHSPKVQKAIEQYREAEKKGEVKPETSYNVGSALHDLGEYEEAVDALNKALVTQDPSLESEAYYNLGNTYFRMQDFQKAAESYQQSLKRAPMDADAKINLELSLKELQQQQQQQKQDQQQNKKQDDQSKESEQDKQQQGDQKDQQKNDQQNQDQNQNQNQQNQPQNQQQKQQKSQANKAMSREDAIRLLNAVRDDEQEIQKRIRREQGPGDYKGKDW